MYKTTFNNRTLLSINYIVHNNGFKFLFNSSKQPFPKPRKNMWETKKFRRKVYWDMVKYMKLRRIHEILIFNSKFSRDLPNSKLIFKSFITFHSAAILFPCFSHQRSFLNLLKWIPKLRTVYNVLEGWKLNFEWSKLQKNFIRLNLIY